MGLRTGQEKPMLPDADTLYAALLARDARFDGLAWVCVTSTGIYCRLTCPAKKPKQENCVFRASVQDCLQAGFRACKRCDPDGVRLSGPALAGLPSPAHTPRPRP
jgi:AraC family transcriptional regulator of adaptative response/methylated-DNA-[protein]-cysteine methyltransferase